MAVDELKFNPDGSVPTAQPTKERPAPVATLDPYKRVEAETIAWSSGVKIEPAIGVGGHIVRDIHAGDHIQCAMSISAHHEGRRQALNNFYPRFIDEKEA